MDLDVNDAPEDRLHLYSPDPYFSNLLDELHCRGNVDVLCLYAHRTEDLLDVGFAKVIKWDNREVVGFRPLCFPGWVERFLPHRNTFRFSLFSALEDFNPDVIHLNGFSNTVSGRLGSGRD